MALSTNWFRTGDRYISLNGGDDGTLDGTDPATPYATIEGAIGATAEGTAGDHILRSGVYSPASTINIRNKNLIGDSENVYIINGVSFDDIVANSGTPSSTTIENINIKGVLRIFEDTGSNNSTVTFKNSTIRNANVVGVRAYASDRVERCLFKYVARIKQYTALANDQNEYTNNTFINCGFKGNSSDATTYIRCYFENCTFNESTDFVQTEKENITFQECVFDANCIFFEGTLVSDIFSKTDANLANGTKSPDGTTTESTDGAVNKGTFTYTFNTTLGYEREVTFQNCFWINKTNTNPFNDDSENVEDYTLKAAANGTQSILYDNGIIIGKYGLSYKPPISTTTFPSTSNVTVTDGAITLNGAVSSGSAQSVAIDDPSGNHIQLPSAVLLTDAIRFFGSSYSFPNDPIGVTASTGNLVDQDKYNSGDATPNVRYTFWLKYKDPDTETIMPVPEDAVDSNPNNWYEIEQGNIFGVELDGNSKGNGDVDVDIAGGLTPIRAREFQVRITLRNDAN